MRHHHSCPSVACVLVLVAALSACSGGGDDDEDEDDFDADASGIWSGTTTPDGATALQNTTLIAIPDGRFAISSGKGIFVGTGTTAATSFTASATGYALPGTTYANGSTFATFSFGGTVIERSSLNGSYSGGNESGRINLQYSASLTQRAASLTTVGGNYSQVVQGATVASLSINAGVMTFSTTSGCTGNGTIQVVDPSRNFYTWSITLSGCPVAPNAPYSGLGYMPTTTGLLLIGSGAGNTAPFAFAGTK